MSALSPPSPRRAARASLLAAAGLAVALSAHAGEYWKTYHDACSAAVLNGQSAVLTGMHYVTGEKHFMFVYEWCMAGNPPAYNLEISRQWPGMPGMKPQTDGPHQV